MRLAFPNGEHDDFTIGRGTFSIGSSDDDDISLAVDSLKSRHVEITVDHRGITLHSETQDAALAVNERAVNQKAILRLGDRIDVAGIQMLLCGDKDRLTANLPGSAAPEPGSRSEPARFLLRGLTGTYLGKAINLYDRLRVGPDDADVSLPAGAGSGAVQIENSQVFLRDGNEVQVNGYPVAEAHLQPGDQLVFGDQRFLLEAPGFVPGKAYAGVDKSSGAGNTQVFSAPVIEAAENKGGSDTDNEDGANGSRRDAIIVTVCLLLSAAMVAWLISVYLSG